MQDKVKSTIETVKKIKKHWTYQKTKLLCSLLWEMTKRGVYLVIVFCLLATELNVALTYSIASCPDITFQVWFFSFIGILTMMWPGTALAGVFAWEEFFGEEK